LRSEALFDDFLNGVVNLNTTRITLLEDSIDAIKSAIEATDWSPIIEGWAPQGSWAHGTIIRPQAGKEFDADLLVFVRPVQGWNAREYIDSLHRELKQNGRYADRLHRYSHCVTIDYAGERRIDVAPVIIARAGGNGLEVCNRTSDGFEQTEPIAYTDWLAGRNAVTEGNALRKVTRLIKYLRDIKQNFSCPSVLLTTLIGATIQNQDFGATDVASVPNTLLTVFRRLDARLASADARISVPNPALRDEEFGLLWADDNQFRNFRDTITRYHSWIEDAYFEEDSEASLKKWQRVFGDEFAKGGVLKEARQISERARNHLAEKGAAIGATEDLVDLVQRFGEQALPPGFAEPSYLEAPREALAAQSISCRIAASEHDMRGGPMVRQISTLESTSKNRWIRFLPVTSTGIPFPSRDYFVRWRVTNTDEMAATQNEIRGNIVDSSEGQIRWEHTMYRGIHLVEAFVHKRANRFIVSKSAPFLVLVE
tara:strand:- start:32171 stop:33619 length:1449 start_codon:yes stop_codon:yes gene_type:complete